MPAQTENLRSSTHAIVRHVLVDCEYHNEKQIYRKRISVAIHISTMMPVLLENEVMQCYAFWTAILIVKLLAMALLTGVFRFKNMV